MEQFLVFHFPDDVTKFENLEDTNVCVIAVIGKTPFQGSKTTVFKRMLDRDTHVLAGDKQEGARSRCSSTPGYAHAYNWLTASLTHGCYDAEKKIVVLECFSGYDADRLAGLIHSDKNFADEWDSVLFTKARVLLYALQVSHIVVCSCPGLSFDTSYIRLFRALDHLRNKLHLENDLAQFGLPKSWCAAGRPTCPRMLFVFNPINHAAFEDLDSSQMENLQTSLEDQIYRVFRKTRIITNNANSALFALPSNQKYVHIMSANENSCSKTNLLKLFDLCSTGQPIDDLKEDDSKTFTKMIMQHVDLAHSGGFGDHIGRNSSSNPFQITKFSTWFPMASHLYTLIVRDGLEGKLASIFSGLKSTIEVEQRFSETRCHKVMQLAEKAYKDNLPEHYTEGVHNEQLAKAHHVMVTSGRGPALQTYLSRLKTDCTGYWEEGHRLCESVSLSGSHCTHQLHRLPEEPITDKNEKLQCFEHSTNVSFTVACNCGRRLQNIGDPFTAKFANYLIYEELAKGCCDSLMNIPFPIYTPSPSSPPAQPASLPIGQSAEIKTEQHDEELNLLDKMSLLTVSKLKQEEEELTTMSDHHSYYNSLSQGHHHRHEVTKTDASVTDDNLETIADESVLEVDTSYGYLSHMLTNSSIKGLLPDYPSWALTCLGDYASYIAANGLDQPGFLPSTNFLLPWEVVIKGIVKDQVWPQVGEPTTHKQRKKMAAKKHVVDTTAKIYIGDAYTCPLGHRFFCSSPEKVIKVTGAAVKDNANKLLTMDMPLYAICPKNEGCVGQLRHIYVCTPEIESLVVSILPKIQPASVPCPLFLPSHDGPIKLPPNGVWVMRLPHFYVDENGHYPLPDKQSMLSCRLLKGTFSFRNTSDPLL